MSKKILEAGGKQYEVIEGSTNCRNYCVLCRYWKQGIEEEPCRTCKEDYFSNDFGRNLRYGRILKPIE